MAGDPPSISDLSSSRSISQVLGSSVQFPVGHKEASKAEHTPAQLVPRPQVTDTGTLFARQQVTVLVWFEKVNVLSKKSTEESAVLLPRIAFVKIWMSHNGFSLTKV